MIKVCFFMSKYNNLSALIYLIYFVLNIKRFSLNSFLKKIKILELSRLRPSFSSSTEFEDMLR